VNEKEYSKAEREANARRIPAERFGYSNRSNESERKYRLGGFPSLSKPATAGNKKELKANRDTDMCAPAGTLI
jgi:hypothetical protein